MRRLPRLGAAPWPEGPRRTPTELRIRAGWPRPTNPAHAGRAVAAPAPATAAAWQPRPSAWRGSDALPIAREGISGDRAARLAARAVGQRDPAPLACHRRRLSGGAVR